jgi:5-hydroxyisourate hydrolase-like protein (transthyretin family)
MVKLNLMKKYLIIAFLLFSISSYSQSFTFNRALFNGSFIKMKGEVIFTDSTMSITTNGIPSIQKVITISKKENYQQFKVVSDTQTDIDIRITFSSNSYVQKKDETFTLQYEAKDNFSNQYTRILYYLIPQNN